MALSYEAVELACYCLFPIAQTQALYARDGVVISKRRASLGSGLEGVAAEIQLQAKEDSVGQPGFMLVDLIVM